MRVRLVCAAAMAAAVVALAPASAGAHPRGCGTALAVVVPAGWFTTDREPCMEAAPARASRAQAVASAEQGSERGRFEEVGHESLQDRGMNAALAVDGDFAYIGSRTDGGHTGQPQGGLMVVDVSKPTRPRLVTEEPLYPRAGESTRELRVWRSKNLLIVLNTNCGVGDRLHHCTVPSISNIRFYDISGRDAKAPRLLHELGVDTHEFFLWVDPKTRERALIFAGNATSTCATRGGKPSCPFSVWDISGVPEGEEPIELYSGPTPTRASRPPRSPCRSRPAGCTH
jgi:hypothetical protein